MVKEIGDKTTLYIKRERERERERECVCACVLFYNMKLKVGNRPVNMSIDQTSGHYWLKPVISGRLVVD